MAASDVLKAMFTSGMKETQTKCVDMSGFSDLALEQLLEFMYTGDIIQDREPILHIAQLWALGDKYNVYGLLEYVNRAQRKYITLENVIGVFVDADKFCAQTRKDSCLAIMGKDLKKLLGEIEKLPEDMLVRMFRDLIVLGVSL